MFVFFGNYSSTKTRGVVADQCPECGQIARFRVIEHYQTPHLYFIPLPGTEMQGVSRECSKCRTQLDCPKGVYERYIPEAEAHCLSDIEVLRETQPRLAVVVEYRQEIEQNAALASRGFAPGMADPRAKLALARLCELNTKEPRVFDILCRFLEWTSLDEAGQRDLLQQVDDLINPPSSEEVVDQVSKFVKDIARLFPDKVDGGLAFLTWLLIVVGGFFLPPCQNFWGGCLLILTATLLAYVVQRWRTRQMVKKWFHGTYLLQANQQGIDVAESLRVLRREASEPERCSDKIQAMWKATPLLLQVIQDKKGEPLDEIAR